ncbi:Uncharacterised protein [Escherichia coli]|nr:Uncharacterised protein [Escherichia coli]
MGLREEIQSEVAAAFDEDLADAVSDFSGSYVTHRHWDLDLPLYFQTSVIT